MPSALEMSTRINPDALLWTGDDLPLKDRCADLHDTS
jgi:hypothetical protein